MTTRFLHTPFVPDIINVSAWNLLQGEGGVPDVQVSCEDQKVLNEDLILLFHRQPLFCIDGQKSCDGCRLGVSDGVILAEALDMKVVVIDIENEGDDWVSIPWG